MTTFRAESTTIPDPDSPPSATTAAEALACFASDPDYQGRDIVGFAYTPVSAPWFRLHPDDRIARDHKGAVLPLDGVFELRAFDGVRELRWWNTSAGRGPSVVISDATMAAIGLEPGAQYNRLLWGQSKPSTQATDRWLTLFEARIGTLWVPVPGPAPEKSAVVLTAVEYHRVDDHGNVSVADERLICLGHQPPQQAPTTESEAAA